MKVIYFHIRVEHNLEVLSQEFTIATSIGHISLSFSHIIHFLFTQKTIDLIFSYLYRNSLN
jgi:hypothetical protein